MMDQHQYREILSLRHAGYVRRAHTIPLLMQQTTAEHSAQALSLLLLLNRNPSVNLIKTLLWHDAPEKYTGDIPSPVKRSNPALKKAMMDAEFEFIAEHPALHESYESLSVEEQSWLRAIDVLELYLWADDQLTIGNTHFQLVKTRTLNWLMNDADTPQPVREFASKHNVTQRIDFV